jgi:hypothetical protein
VSETAVAATIGLTAAEAERRLRERGPLPKLSTSRSYRSIAIANTFTVFNLILAVFGAATLLFGNPRDALFLGILIANTAIGTALVRARSARPWAGHLEQVHDDDHDHRDPRGDAYRRVDEIHQARTVEHDDGALVVVRVRVSRLGSGIAVLGHESHR